MSLLLTVAMVRVVLLLTLFEQDAVVTAMTASANSVTPDFMPAAPAPFTEV
jgi:hypothetical protein